jgi:hypothetical protein
MSVNVGQKLKLLWGRVAHDPEARIELRQLFLGLVIVVMVCYGAQTLLIKPRQQGLQKKISQQKELVATLANGEIEAMVGGQLQQLMTKKKELTEGIAQLRFERQLYQEQFHGDNSKEQFSNVIFTLLPDSPVNIEGNFLQMNVMDTRSFDHFDVSPVNLQGDADYLEFLSYLQYLEKRPEVGIINDIVLEQFNPEAEQSEASPEVSPEAVEFVDAFVQPVRVHFSLVLGRVQLH